MIVIAQWSLLLMLFLLIYMFAHGLLRTLTIQHKARLRLRYVQRAKFGNRMAEWISRYNIVHRHLNELLEASSRKVGIGLFLTANGFLLLVGLTVGGFFFQSVKGVIALSIILGMLPYVLLRMKLLSIQLKTRLEFLPAVEVFYQYYILCGQKNMKTALKESLAENRIRYPLRPVFEHLYRNLMTNQDTEHALRVFSLALGHIWGDYFVNMVRVALVEGNNISDSLKELITDMRKAQRADQAERNRLLEIRIANFTPILFLGLFLFLNFKINSENAYVYYVLDPAGRNIVLDALLLIFASFIMGLYLSMRRM